MLLSKLILACRLTTIVSEKVCSEPPPLEHGNVQRTNATTAEYQCSEGFTISGDDLVACDSSFHWQKPPDCLGTYMQLSRNDFQGQYSFGSKFPAHVCYFL